MGENRSQIPGVGGVDSFFFWTGIMIDGCSLFVILKELLSACNILDPSEFSFFSCHFIVLEKL